MRLTGSMVMRFIPRSLSEFHLEIAVWLFAVQQIMDDSDDGFRRWWTAGQADINPYEFAQRTSLLQQCWDAISRHAFFFVSSVYIYALQQLLNRNRIAHCGNIAGDGAIAHRDQNAGTLPDFLNLIQIFLRADCTFDESDVHVFGKFLRVYERAVNQIDLARQGNDGPVHIEQRHMAAG